MVERPPKEVVPLTPTEIRSLRDQVFSQIICDKEWAHVGMHWMRADSVEWLKNKALRPIVL